MSSLRQQVKAFVDANLAPPARSARLAALAIDMRDGLIQSGRAPPVYKTYVDGREGAPETSIRGTGGGTIAYVFSNVAEAAVFALAFLRERAPGGRPPRDGVRYKDSFWVAVNGRYIRPGAFAAKSVPADAKIVIGNTKPYNRKADVQMVGGKSLHYDKPSGLFDDCVRALTRQFGGTIAAERVYTIAFPGQYQLARDQYRLTGRYAGYLNRRAGRAVESPALVISPAEA